MESSTGNTTDNSTAGQELSLLSKINIGSVVIMFSVVTYVFIVLIYFEWKIRKRDVRKNTLKYGKYMRFARMATVVGFVLVCFTSVAKIISDATMNNELCKGSMLARIISSCGLLTGTYGVAWFRQRAIYVNHSMLHLTSRITKTCSDAVGVLLVFIFISNTVFYTTFQSYEILNGSCLPKKSDIPDWIFGVTFLLISTLMQFILLGLFIYPLAKHRFNMRNMETNSIYPVIKRSFLTTIVAVTTDIARAIMIMTDLPLEVKDTAVELNLMMNCFMVIVIFPEWRSTIFPCCVTNTVEPYADNRKKTINIGDKYTIQCKTVSEDLL